MSKIILSLILLVTSNFSFSQEVKILGERAINEKGEIISETNFKRYVFKEESELIDFFYKNQNNYDELKNILSFRMFQLTPEEKFQDIIKTKIFYCGKLIEKKLISKEIQEIIKTKIFYSPDSDEKKIISKEVHEKNQIVFFEFEVQYSKVKTIEKIGIIKESPTDDFTVYEYNIKENL